MRIATRLTARFSSQCKSTVVARISLIAFALSCYSAGASSWSKPAHTWGGPGTDAASSVAIAPNGVAYIAGTTSSFGAGSNDVLLAKYGATGGFLWAKTWGGSGDDHASAIKLGPDGNLYVAGGTSSFGAGWYDGFLLKLDTSGNVKWAYTWGGGSFDQFYDLGFDSSGNIFVVGESYSFGNCVVLLKFAPNGNLLWTASWKGPATYDSGYSLAVDAGGNVIISGISWDYSFYPVHNSILLLKYDTNGNFVWSENWSSTFPSQDESSSFHALATDSANSIYLGGRHADQCTESPCDFDALVLKVDLNGHFQWAQTWGNSGYDTAGSVGLDPSGHIIVSGMQDAYGTPSQFVLSYDSNGNLLSAAAWSQGNPSNANYAAMTLDSVGNGLVVGSALNNQGVWAATSASVGSLTNSLISTSYTLGAPSAQPSLVHVAAVRQVGTQDTGGGGSDLFVAQYRQYMSGGPFITVFPLPNLKPNSPQRINSIFDHTMSYQYCPSTDVNGHRTVMAYDGEEGSSQFGPGSQVGSKPFGCNPTGKYSDLFGYQNGQGAFDLYGEYYGAGTPDFLFYEGHPGYDYRAACHTQVLAAASGTVHYPTQIPGAGGAKFHILEIDPDATSTYKIYYLHLANWLSNNCIYSGKAQNCSCTDVARNSVES